MEINFKNTTNLRVRYAETDQMGYVYYGNYAQYFEVGRVEAMRAVGISYKDLENQGFMLPVMDLNIKYHSPALYDDELQIETTIVSLNGVRLLFEYVIFSKNKKLCSGSTTLVFVNKSTMRPVSPPVNFIALFDKK